ncbi:hypothetical protein [Bacillus sp. JCM 19041]|uniref:hypothetical protein n=1 Tax=Bacillus sp. JCM 19041 TaxID=1460637 RepID=UPI000AB554A5
MAKDEILEYKEDNGNQPSRVYKWVIGGLEAILGFPILGGLFIISMSWSPLYIMLVLHIIGLVLASRESRSKTGHIIGIFASALGWILG